MISTTKERWGRMDFAVAQRRDISAIAKVVYAILKCYENDETGRCDPSQAMIADDAGASLGSVKRAIKQLIDARIIDADRVPGSTRNAYRFLDPSVQNDTTPRVQNDTPRVQNDTSMGPKCDLHESILIPPRVQNDTSLLYNDEKNRKEQEKTSTSAGAIISDDPGYIQPSPEQQQIAREMLDRWNKKYPHTLPVADRLGDELAMQTLQTIHRLDRDQIEAIVNGIGESGKIKFWKRPKYLTRRKSGSDDEPYVWQEIQSEVAVIEAAKTPAWIRELDREEVAV